MKKQILSMVMAGALVMSASTVAFAADAQVTAPNSDGAYSSEVTATGETKVPTIDITLSDTSSKKVGLNPYGLKYSVDTLTDATDAIVTKEETITNASDVPIAINATTSAEAKGEVVLASAALKGTETTKSVFAYLQIDKAATLDAKAYDSKAANQIVFGTKATTKKAMVTLTDKDGADTVATYKILGGVASKPAKAWASTDTVDFKIVYQFEPVVATTTP